MVNFLDSEKVDDKENVLDFVNCCDSVKCFVCVNVCGPFLSRVHRVHKRELGPLILELHEAVSCHLSSVILILSF